MRTTLAVTVAAAATLVSGGHSAALAQIVSAPWPTPAGSNISATAAASRSGLYATADTASDTVEIRDIDRALVRTLTRAQITAALPWMSLDGSPDGPSALAFSDSGRLLFIGVHDGNTATDGRPSDAVLRLDTDTGELSVFARAEWSDGDSPLPGIALLHARGTLFVGDRGDIRAFRALRNDLIGFPQYLIGLADAAMVTGLAYDRTRDRLYAAVANSIAAIELDEAGRPVRWLGEVPGLNAIAFDEDGVAGAAGSLAIAAESVGGAGGAQVFSASQLQLDGIFTWSPTLAWSSNSDSAADLAATVDGGLLLGGGPGALMLRNTRNPALGFEAWINDEFDQHIRFAKGLITNGWVIDADVPPGATRFHPATPDAAAWVVLALIAADDVRNDAAAQLLIRSILVRYAGQATDGIAPSRTQDGIYRHWIDRATGQAQPGWDPEFATLSTMKIVLAAERAAARYPGDPIIQDAAEAIVCGVRDWATYFTGSDRRTLFFKALASAPDPSSAARGFHEGFIFAELTGRYGGPQGELVFNAWRDPLVWPTAEFITARPIRGNTVNSFLPAFVSLYEALISPAWRASPGWATHTENLRASHAAWTDDNAPLYATVFSAGTTKAEWGSYNADSLSNHPGDVATFTALIASSRGVRAQELGAAYHAYRRGARQSWLSGASLLYRRSNIDPAYLPNSAGVPDTTYAALALAERLQPGWLDTMLSRAAFLCTCPADYDNSGGVDGDDITAFFTDWQLGEADIDRSGGTDGDDIAFFFARWQAGC